MLDAELTDEGVLRARLKVSPDGSARPEELLEALGLRDLLDQGAVLVANRRGAGPMTEPWLSARGRTESGRRRGRSPTDPSGPGSAARAQDAGRTHRSLLNPNTNTQTASVPER